MMRGWKGWTLAVAGTLLGGAGGCAGAGGAPAGKAEILQTVTGLNNPESAVFSLDGKWLFVTNCASAEFGADKHVAFVAGEASVSKLSVAPDGTLSLVNPKFVQKLSGTLGVTVAPRAVGPYPAGSLFVCVGGALVAGDAGAYVADAAALGTGIAVLDPESGATLGKIQLGAGS